MRIENIFLGNNIYTYIHISYVYILCLFKLIIFKILGREKIKDEGKPQSFRSKITLEPMWFGVTVSMVMGVFAFKNLFLQRACMVDLGYSEDICLRSVGEMRAKVEVSLIKIYVLFQFQNKIIT